MDRINKSGTSGKNMEKEIIINKNKKKTVEKPLANTTNARTFDMVSLAELNIFGGIFEGGVIGAGIGLNSYSKSMNTDKKPLVTGALIGTFTGAGLAAGLSLWQSVSKRYSSSDDFGYDLIGGSVIGACLGAAGGSISYGKTGHLENVSEGAGLGIAIGAGLGLVLGAVEAVIPEEYRGVSGKLHVFNIQQLDGTTVVSCNIKY
jgi:hypothetical protein